MSDPSERKLVHEKAKGRVREVSLKEDERPPPPPREEPGCDAAGEARGITDAVLVFVGAPRTPSSLAKILVPKQEGTYRLDVRGKE